MDANLITVLAGVLGSVSGASAIAIFLIPVTFYVIERLFAGRESKLAFFAPKHIAIPVAVTAFPNEPIKPRGVGRRRRIPNSFTTIGSTRAATSRPGNSRRSS